MKKLAGILFLVAIFFTGTTKAQFEKTAFINGKIYTVNEKQPMAEAVVIERNKILFVGSNADANKIINKETKVIDLKGRFMMPGFIDAHTHFISGGFYLTGLDLNPAKSRAEFIQILKDYIKGKEDRWITEGNWD
ncbi:MAG TPA: amidohydrolase family protein, partial [Ignavibacteriaceae bacterium]|nr:amidohydrolase family protein [Ignavibacteriaceae bacterium]